jgi:hypothetical protein
VDPHGGTDGKPLENGRGEAPACRCSPVAAGKGNGGVRNSPQGSPELGERWSGGVTRVKWWWRWGSTGACSGVREEGREVVGVRNRSGVEVAFYRGRGEAGAAGNRGRRR